MHKLSRIIAGYRAYAVLKKPALFVSLSYIISQCEDKTEMEAYRPPLREQKQKSQKLYWRMQNWKESEEKPKATADLKWENSMFCRIEEPTYTSCGPHVRLLRTWKGDNKKVAFVFLYENLNDLCKSVQYCDQYWIDLCTKDSEGTTHWALKRKPYAVEKSNWMV